MPRLRVVKKPEDSAKIPEDQPVAVELAEEVESEVTVDTTKDEPETIEVPEKKPVAAKKEEAESEEDSGSLKKQLDDLRKANELVMTRVAEAERQRAEYERQYTEASKKLTDHSARADQAEFDSVINALTAASTELESAKRDMLSASEAGNVAGQGDAQVRIAQAAARVMQLEDGKAALEARQERQKQELETKKTEAAEKPKNPTVEEYIDGIPNLLAAERTWLKSHPELMTDGRKNTRLQSAYLDAEDNNLARGSDGYFQFLEEKLGYRKVKQEEEVEEDNKPHMVSAPVSRDTVSPSTGKPSSTRVTLTVEEREAAKMSGVDELTYARQLQKLRELKKQGHYA